MKFVTTKEPEPKQEKGEFGIAKVSMVNGNVKVEMKSTEHTYTIKKEDIPEYFPYKEKAALMAHVTMNDVGDKMMYAVPARGDYDAGFLYFGKKDEKPVARTNQYGQSFGAVIEITSKSWAGAQLIKWFNLQEPKEGYSSYCRFSKDEEGNLAIDGYGAKYEELAEFFKATGIADMVIPYSENPLPAIQDLILQVGKKFLIGLSLNTKSNYMDVIIQEDFALTFDEDAEEVVTEAGKGLLDE